MSGCSRLEPCVPLQAFAMDFQAVPMSSAQSANTRVEAGRCAFRPCLLPAGSGWKKLEKA